jgi:hypothetical protein
MTDSDDETSSYHSGYITPPLSPSKTVSTEGWFSPRTPSSPRKTRSCHFSQAINYDTNSPFFTPPASPTKSKSTLFLSALNIPETLYASSELSPPQYDYDSLVKQVTPVQPRGSSSTCSFSSIRLHIPLTPDAAKLSREKPSSPSVKDHGAPTLDGWPEVTRRVSHRSLSDSQATIPLATSCLTSFALDTIVAATDSLVSTSPYKITLVGEGSSATKLRRYPLRSASSPLRPGQWIARGGSPQSPRRGPACTLDRYIGCRRPPNVTRESFELNKPAERLDINQGGREGRPSNDPFSRRLRRSGRLNDELRGLREAHSLIIGRASTHRRNAHLVHRRVSSIIGTRQVSTGAVWNVGGPSAVSDTVTGVSTGRGSMLGSGTNAPLYTSTFLNRADPEAELEAYERRIALALDVDQTERILQHSPTHSTSYKTSIGDSEAHMKHTWRDSAWIKDGVTLRLSPEVIVPPSSSLTNYLLSNATVAAKPTKTCADLAVQIRFCDHFETLF